MGRKILLVTVGAQRPDGLSGNGGSVATTPVVDRLGATGINYRCAVAPSVVATESRSSLLTGRMPAPPWWCRERPERRRAPQTVAERLFDHGYRTAVVGRFEWPGPIPLPGVAGPGASGAEREGWHGFEHVRSVDKEHSGASDYGRWLASFAPELVQDGSFRFARGDTGLVGAGSSLVPPELYHADWTAEQAIAWLAERSDDEDWFCWVSFADPGSPWTPPAEEVSRLAWVDVPLPASHPGSARACRKVLAGKPPHWLASWSGAPGIADAPAGFVAARMTLDQVREVNALAALQAELVDRALGRVLDYLAARGWDPMTEVVYTAATGALQGDLGLLFPGPFAADALVRVPLLWRPAPARGIVPGEVRSPVSLVSVAPTLCSLAGVAWGDGEEARVLPLSDQTGDRAERCVLRSPSGEVDGVAVVAEGWLAAVYGGRTESGLAAGELYDLPEDPCQLHNRWEDPACRAWRRELHSLLDAGRAPRSSGREGLVASA